MLPRHSKSKQVHPLILVNLILSLLLLGELEMIDKCEETTFLGKTVQEHEADIEETRDNYKRWREHQHSQKAGFFPVFSNDFKPYLKDLSGNAVRLYIYLGLHSDNETGDATRATLHAMQSFFNCDVRTLQKWLAELETANLIKRIQPKYKATRRILLNPYSTSEHLNLTRKIETEEKKIKSK